MRGRAAQAGLPQYTAPFLQSRPRPGDILVCFDEYAGCFAGRNEVHGYGSVDDRAEELPRLLSALEPLLGREEDLWVQCSPNRAAARAEERALSALGFALSGFPSETDGRRACGSSGAFAITALAVDEAEQAARQAALDRAAADIRPCGRTFAELEGFLARRWGGVPHKCLPHERDAFLSHVLMGQWCLEGRDVTSLWPHDAVQWLYDHPEERADWDVRCMKLTALRRPEPEHRVAAMVYSYAPDEVLFQFEVRREASSPISGPVDEAEMERFGDELTLWRGVTEEDIRTRSPRFQFYVYTLKKLGRL